MNKEAIATVKATFEANPQAEQFFANEFGHCFKSAAEGLTQVKREEVDGLVADEENPDAQPAAGKGKKKK